MRRIFYIILLSSTTALQAQVSVVNALYNTYNITPNSITQLNILNSQSNNVDVIIESTVYNSNNEVILSVKTNAIILKPGLNTISNSYLTFQNVRYASTKQAEYVRNTKRIPSGIYKFCSTVTSISNSEALDHYCEDVQSDLSNFLVLANPMDKDTVSVKNPLLMWNHSEPFDILITGEYYKLILVKLKDGQTAEDGVNMNQPIYMKDFLNSHQVQYPVDAPNLESGQRYGWQVQKVTNNTVTNKSESWEFTVPITLSVSDLKYTVLQKKLNASYYSVPTNKLYFSFDEEYTSSNNLKCTIYDADSAYTPNFSTTIVNVDNTGIVYKKTGENRYYIDLLALGLNTQQYYFLEVENEKKEKFYSKFYISSTAW